MTADIRAAAHHKMVNAGEVADEIHESGERVVTELTSFGHGFTEGAVWGAARVTPTQAQIESAILGRTATAGARAVMALLAGLAEGESG